MSKSQTKPAFRWPIEAAGALLPALAALFLASCGVIGGGGDEGPSTPSRGNRTAILSRIAQVEVDASLANTAVIVPPAQVNATWPQAGGNAAKAPGHATIAEAPTRVWTARIAGTTNTRRLAAAPVVADGMLFAVDTSAVVYAFDAATGARKWQHEILVSGDLRDATFGGGAAYDGGRIYATNGVGDVVALDATNGTEIWRVKPAGPLRGAPTVAFNSVYVMTQDNQIYALSATDGATIWQDSASSGQSGLFGVAAPAAAQGTVVTGYSSGELVAYRYENGRNLWSDALSRTVTSTQVGALTDIDADPIIDQGRVYALGQGGRMVAYEMVTGQRLWELTLAGVSTPTIAGEWVFTLTDDARILAIQRNSGRIRWMTQLEQWRDPEDREGPIFWTGPVLANNRLWIASSRGNVRTVDVLTGVATDFTRLSNGVSLAPIVANQTLYMLDDGGTITAWR